MKILITGASGFIGLHLVSRLKTLGIEVHAIIRETTNNVQHLKDLNVPTFTVSSDIENLTRYMVEESFDGVIHLASLFLAQHKSSDVQQLVNSNVTFPAMILEAAVKSEIPWFINTGTFWQHYEDQDYSPVNLYAATKQAFEAIATYYIETSSITFTTIKLSDTFGPLDTRVKILNLWNRIRDTDEFLELSPGEQRIDLNYIDNVVDAFVQLIGLLSDNKSIDFNGRCYAVSSGETMSLKDLAELFQSITGSTLPIKWGAKNYRPREVMQPWTTGEVVPGWTPQVSVAEGIKRTFGN